jgi:hypothetical protein
MTSPPIFFRNNDLGEYQERIKEKSKKKKRRIKKRQAALLQMFISQATQDKNHLTDPYEFSVTPIPFAPAEPAPIGLNDGIWPISDMEGRSYNNLYYGILEEHFADTQENEEDDEEDTKNEDLEESAK